MRRRDFMTLLGGAAVSWPLAAPAQQAGKVYRIGFLGNDPSIPTQAAGKAFLDGLRENGFIEGKNIVIERRFAEGRGDRALELATELVRLDVDLIVTSSPMAAKQVTTKIPIVMVNVFDPIGMGVVTSLAHPDGNITGLASHVSPEMAGKRMALLKEAIPRISRIAVLMNPDRVQDKAQWNVLQNAAPSLDVTLRAVSIGDRNELEGAFAAMRRERPDALFGLYNAQTLIFRKPIAEFAAEERLPAMFPFFEAAEAGGLMSYGASRSDMFRRAAAYVAKILKGAKPGDLPIEQPTKFEFVINLKTAKALGLTISPSILLLADELID